MKRLLVAGALTLAAVGQVMAADLPLPYPAPQPPASYYPGAAPMNWGGFYIGANGGYGFGSSSWTGTGVATGSFDPRGFLVGGTIGLNMQASNFVFGVETDADWTNLHGSSSAAYCSAVSVGAVCETKSDVVGTLRARIGYAFDRVLVYGAGGLAYGNLQTGYNPPATFDTNTNFGWTAGAGVEFAFADRWSAKVEYLYVNLGSVSCTSANCGAGVPITVPFTENIVRAGVNFRFGPW